MILPFQESLPPVPREFRAAWIATVDNIDWPSKPGLPAARQKAEMIRLLDRAASLRLNAIVFQVRPAADAFYRSKLEPWSEYLTGRQGKDPGYDPLEFAVAEAHRRGLELHCWFNPYRARHSTAKGPLAPNHLFRTNPTIVKPYGKQLWMDPGEPLVQQRSREVFLDVARRYDIDGVHMDDYFYPYPERSEAFPDANVYARYGVQNGMSLKEWRRKNVDDFVRTTYTEVHKIKPWLRFGISPFGVYRPSIPPTITAGIDQYDTLYADPLKWLREGWLDYLAPQLYWAIDQKLQSYRVLLDWWRSQNVRGRQIWPGLFTSRLLPGEPKGGYNAVEIVRQIELTRKPGTGDRSGAGHIHFSIKALAQDSMGVSSALRGKLYAEDALPPACPWLGDAKPLPPVVEATAPSADSIGLKIQTASGAEAAKLVVWLRYGSRWRIRVLPGSTTALQEPKTLAWGGLNRVAVASASRTGILSDAASVLP